MIPVTARSLWLLTGFHAWGCPDPGSCWWCEL